MVSLLYDAAKHNPQKHADRHTRFLRGCLELVFKLLGDADVNRLVVGVHVYEKPPDIWCNIRGLSG